MSALMPGVRHVRNPLLIGWAWLYAVYLLIDQARLAQWAGHPIVMRSQALFESLGAGYVVAALSIAAYLIGTIAVDITGIIGARVARSVSGLLERVIQGSRAKIASTLNRRWFRISTPAHNLQMRLRGESPDIRGLILNYIAGQYARAGAPSGASLDFPLELVLERLDVSAMQLWEDSAEQYQEIDRLRSEAELRFGLILPLGILGGVVCAGTSWWNVPFVLLLLFFVLRQAVSSRLRAREMVATLAYLNQVEVPIVAGAIEVAKELVKDVEDPSRVTWVGAMAGGLSAIGEFEASQAIVEEAISGGIDVREPYFHAIEDVVAEWVPELCFLMERMREEAERDSAKAPDSGTEGDAEGSAS